ncbi:MAG: hypothetical protein ACI8PP_002170, partial [Candidatus Pseudothioglobus sp.]
QAFLEPQAVQILVYDRLRHGVTLLRNPDVEKTIPCFTLTIVTISGQMLAPQTRATDFGTKKTPLKRRFFARQRLALSQFFFNTGTTTAEVTQVIKLSLTNVTATNHRD